MNITIVGGGFGGVKTALELAKVPGMSITLISDKPDFQYYPALYSSATGYSHLESWVPLTKIFKRFPKVKLVIDTITAIDTNNRELTGSTGASYTYGTCVLALGSVTTYFGIPGLAEYSFGIKSAEEITKLKQHLFQEMSEHLLEKHYVIVGGGPTGTELAAALGQYIERLRKYFGLRKHKIYIDLIEASPRILNKMSEMSSRRAQTRLEKLGVNVMTGQAVESATVDSLIVGGKPIKSHTVIWTSGVANNPFFKANESQFKLAPNGRVIVDEHLKAAKHVYVIGDNAVTSIGLAQIALHDAVFITKNMKRARKHKPLLSYKKIMPPTVVPLGEQYAVFDWKWVHLSGWPASLIRKAADYIGYRDILPVFQALGVWHAQRVPEDDLPALPTKK